MRYLLLLSAIFVISACQSSITVMTYNIYHGEDPYERGNSNLEAVAEVIKKVNPDVVFLQEVDSMTLRSMPLNGGERLDFVSALATKTGRNGYFSKAIDYSEGGYGEGLLLKKPTSIIRATLPFPAGGEQRSLIGAVGDEKVLLLGTHLCHQYTENRMAQVDALIDTYLSHQLPTVLGGDFNFGPDSPEYRQLTKYFYDAAVLAGNTQATHDAKNPTSRIDYIFLSKSSEWDVKDVYTNPSHASDHLPLVVTIKTKRKSNIRNR